MRAFQPASAGIKPAGTGGTNASSSSSNNMSSSSDPAPSPVEDKSFWDAISTFAKVDFSGSKDAEVMALRMTLDDFSPVNELALPPPPSPQHQQQQQEKPRFPQPLWTSTPSVQLPPLPSPHFQQKQQHQLLQPLWSNPTVQAPSPQVLQQGRSLLRAAPSYYQLPMFNNPATIPFPSPRAAQSQSISPPSSVRGATLTPLDYTPPFMAVAAKRLSSPDRDRTKKVRSSDSDTASDCSGVPSSGSPLAIVGESRLKVQFEKIGDIGELPQKFGKSGLLVGSRVTGTHEMYEQHWRFDVSQGETVDDSTALVTWTIVNLSSGTTVSITETPKQAKVRQTSGRTICNRVLKQALAVRFAELERILETLHDNPTRAANIRSLMRVIAPRRCTVGLLFFGLLHECVQKKLQSQVPGGARSRSMSQLDIDIDEADFGHHNNIQDTRATQLGFRPL